MQNITSQSPVNDTITLLGRLHIPVFIRISIPATAAADQITEIAQHQSEGQKLDSSHVIILFVDSIIHYIITTGWVYSTILSHQTHNSYAMDFVYFSQHYILKGYNITAAPIKYVFCADQSVICLSAWSPSNIHYNSICVYLYTSHIRSRVFQQHTPHAGQSGVSWRTKQLEVSARSSAARSLHEFRGFSVSWNLEPAFWEFVFRQHDACLRATNRAQRYYLMAGAVFAWV